MKKLITIISLTALTALTSTAWAMNDLSESYSGPHNKADSAHSMQMMNNQLDTDNLMSKQNKHKDMANLTEHMGTEHQGDESGA